MVQQTTTDRWLGGIVASHEIYQICVQRRLNQEVFDIYLAQTAWRPKDPSVMLPSPASIINLPRFIPDLCYGSGDAGRYVNV